jgi:glucose/arabinose dehydrogenase
MSQSRWGCTVLVLSAGSVALGQGPLLRSEPVALGLSMPLFLTAAPGDTQRAFVVEYLGAVRILNLASGQVLAAPFLDISARVASNGGLLGLAVDPEFAATRHVYIYWIELASGDSIISRFSASAANPNVADPQSEYTVARIPRPFGHHGGWLAFGPDNRLWLSSGDAGFTNLISPFAQDLTVLLGKLIRIDPRGDDFPVDPGRNYRIPSDNPSLGAGSRPEIWSYGLRNAFRGSFDRATGDLYLADVGHNDREELNILVRSPAGLTGGQNFGWPCREGFLCTTYGGCGCASPGLTAPVMDYPHTIGRCITGGYVYRGQAIPGLRGTYLFADFEDHKFFSLYRPLGAPAGANTVAGLRERTAELQLAGDAITQPVSFGEDAAGELYILSFDTGAIYRVAATGACYPNCDGSTTPPMLNVLDFNCFLNRFVAADPYANCDGSTTAPVLNVLDFNCFLNAFTGGCG